MPGWWDQITNAAAFAAQPGQSKPTFGDSLQGIGDSMMSHYKGVAPKGVMMASNGADLSGGIGLTNPLTLGTPPGVSQPQPLLPALPPAQPKSIDPAMLAELRRMLGQ